MLHLKEDNYFIKSSKIKKKNKNEQTDHTENVKIKIFLKPQNQVKAKQKTNKWYDLLNKKYLNFFTVYR